MTLAGITFPSKIPYEAYEFIDNFGRDRSGCIAERDGLHYFVKRTASTDDAHKDLLAHNLVSRLMNVPAVVVPDASLQANLAAILRTRGDHAPDAASAVHLVRLCQGYDAAALPITDLTQAIAAEIVFSTWINRRDAHNSNRVYRAGIPMFFDFGVAFDTAEGGRPVDFFRDGPDSGFVANWRLWEVPKSMTMDTGHVRDLERDLPLALHPVHDAAAFWRHVDFYHRVIDQLDESEISGAVVASIPDPRRADMVSSFLIDERRRLGAKLSRVRELMR